MAVALLSPSAALADEPLRLGIVVHLTVNMEPAEARDLAAKLGRTLREKLDVEVVAGEAVERRLRAEGLSEECVAQPTCVRDVARRLDADQLLFLAVVQVGTTVQIDSTWADRDGRTLSRDPMLIEGRGKAPARVFAEAAPGLLPRFAKKKTSRRRTTSGADVSDVHKEGFSPPGVVPIAVSGGLTVGALAAGIAVTLGGRAEYQAALEQGCDQRDCGAALDPLRSRSMFQSALFGAAAVAGVATLLFYLANETPPDVAVAPVGAGPGLALGGVF